MGCFYYFCPRKEVRLTITKGGNQRGSEKRELDELRSSYNQKKASLSLEGGSVNGGDFLGQALSLKNISEKTFFGNVHLQLTKY